MGGVTSGRLCCACGGETLLMSTRPSGLSVKGTALCSNGRALFRAETRDGVSKQWPLRVPALHNGDITRHKKSDRGKKITTTAKSVHCTCRVLNLWLHMLGWSSCMSADDMLAVSGSERASEWEGDRTVFITAHLTLRSCRAKRVKCHRGHLQRA